MAAAQVQHPEPAITEAKESREPEATPDAAIEKTVTPGAATAKKPRIIKAPVEQTDHTLYCKTYTGDDE